MQEKWARTDFFFKLLVWNSILPMDLKSILSILQKIQDIFPIFFMVKKCLKLDWSADKLFWKTGLKWPHDLRPYLIFKCNTFYLYQLNMFLKNIYIHAKIIFLSYFYIFPNVRFMDSPELEGFVHDPVPEEEEEAQTCGFSTKAWWTFCHLASVFLVTSCGGPPESYNFPPNVLTFSNTQEDIKQPHSWTQTVLYTL